MMSGHETTVKHIRTDGYCTAEVTLDTKLIDLHGRRRNNPLLAYLSAITLRSTISLEWNLTRSSDSECPLLKNMYRASRLADCG